MSEAISLEIIEQRICYQFTDKALLAQALVRKFNCLFWRGLRLRRFLCSRNTVLRLGDVAKLDELRKLFQVLNVDPARV